MTIHLKTFLPAFALFLSVLQMQALTVTHLKTQDYTNPIGLDAAPVHFSWMLESQERGVVQQSYSVQVATDATFGSVIWESGNVQSAQSVDVEATGLSLQPGTRYYWRVMVADNKGNEVQSTEKAYFETGLMTTDAWSSTKWIKASTLPQGSTTTSTADIKNYEVQVKFQVESLAAGLIFAAQDHSNYYMWQVNTLTGSPRFRPHRWTNGSAACLAEKNITTVSIKNGEEHTLRIVVANAKTATTYVDGKQIDRRTGDFAYGDFGFREDYDNGNVPEQAYFDDFLVISSGDTLLSEDFGDEDLKQFSGGSVTDGRFYLSGPGTYSWQQKVGKSVCYDVDVDMTLINDNASVCFGAVTNDTYMMWAVNTYDVSQPVLRRHVYNAGTLSYSDTQISLTKDEIINQPHHLKLECKTPYVRTYIDGQLVDTFRDEQGVLAVGDVGFRVSATGNEREKAYFDNIRQTVYNDDGTSSVTLSEDFEGTDNAFGSDDVQEYNGSHQIYMAATAGSSLRTMQQEGSVLPGATMVRKSFQLKGVVKKARLYATGLGIYNVYINGRRVGQIDDDGNLAQDELKPGSTDFNQTVFYTTHDVTSLLQEGPNAIGAEVTSGWWSGGIAHGEFGSHDCAFRALLQVTYEDGSSETFPTDLSWTSNTNGPLRKGDIYNGETYDARLQTDWTEASFDDSEWYGTSESTDFKGTIRSFEGPAIEAVPALKRLPQTTKIYEGTDATGTTYGALHLVEEQTGGPAVTLKAGQTVIYDLGQNAAGWVSFTAKGTCGTRLRFRFSEMLNQKGDSGKGDDGPAGSLYLINLRTAEATLHYTMSGAAEGESFHPTTTYFGFRYIEVTSSADVELSNVVGETVTSAVEEHSSFSTSHPDVNQLYSNIMWGQRSNFVSVPTDCPQRDERLGWTADTQVYSMAGLYNGDTRNFYKKWMRDMRDSQNASGAYPHVAPYSWGVGYGAAAWADAGIILPYKVWLMTGDTEIIRENYTSMEKYMDYLTTQAADGYQYNGGTTTYGDWVSFVSTDSRYISVCYYAYDAQLMAAMSRAIGQEAKAEKYETLFQNIRSEWQKRYLNTSKIPTQTTQCGYLMALRYNLLPDSTSIARVKSKLKLAISSNAYKLNTGFLGTAILNQTLSQVGLNDEAYTLLLQRNCPSWLYSVDQGATTVWERWNSYTKDGGFHKDISMNSFNHYAYGAVAEWMFRQMAGIAPDTEQPGFRHFLLQPHPDTRTTLRYSQQRITWTDADFWSDYGSIQAHWDCDGTQGSLTYRVTIPANTTATLYMPVKDGYGVLESGTPADEAEGVQYLGTSGGYAQYLVGSGSYVFSEAEQTDIDAVQAVPAALSVPHNYYTLGGVHLPSEESLRSGVYIDNGKKILK